MRGSRFIIRKFVGSSLLRSTLLAGLFGVFAIPAYAGLVVGGFSLARGGIESLASGGDTALAADIQAAIPGTTFSFSDTLTPAFLGAVNAVILGDATTNTSAIAPLTASEQTALLNFVLGGGTAVIFTDNSTFSANAPTVNASMLSPFGVTASGTLGGTHKAPIANLNGPLTTPFGPVTQFATNFPGFYTSTGQGQVLAQFAPGEAAIDYFAPGVLGVGSGKVVLFSDSNAMIAGDSLTATNLNLVLNALSPVPEPSQTTLFIEGLLAMLGASSRMKRRHRSRASCGQ